VGGGEEQVAQGDIAANDRRLANRPAAAPSFGRLSRAAEGLQTCEAERLLATVNQGKQLFKTGIALVQFPLLKMCQPVPSPAVCAYNKNSPIHNGISTPSHQKRSVSRSSLIIPGCHKPSADIIRL